MPHLMDAPTAAYQRRLVRLAFLAPEIQAAILDGRQPAGLNLDRLIRTPLAGSWATKGGFWSGIAVFQAHLLSRVTGEWVFEHFSH